MTIYFNGKDSIFSSCTAKCPNPFIEAKNINNFEEQPSHKLKINSTYNTGQSYALERIRAFAIDFS